MIKLLILFLMSMRLINSSCSRGCLKCDTTNKLCLYCDITLDYLLENGKCIKLKYENCLKYDITGSCSKCETNYYVKEKACVAVQETNLIENCLVYRNEVFCEQCKKDQYFNQGKCQDVPVQIIGCTVYQAYNYQQCNQCEEGYMRSRDLSNCIKVPFYENCATYGYIKCRKCLNNFDINKNMYFNKINDLGKGILTLSIFNDFYINALQTPTFQCQQTTITNCKEFESWGKCKICEQGYFLKDQQCQKSPVKSIVNCSKYKNEKICLECNQNYFLKNENTCEKVSIITDCEEYSRTVNTTVCLRCINTKILTNQVCLDRTQLISKCKQHIAGDSLCQICDEGFVPTSDKKLCLQAIENCITYQDSDVNSVELSCKYCIEGQTYIQENKKCEQGTKNNCLRYNINNDCLDCKFGYYKQDQECIENTQIPHCQTYGTESRGVCLECEQQYLLFTKVNICKKTNNIENCQQFEKQNKCKKCKIGYILQTIQNQENENECVKIDPSLNCNEIEGDFCLQCQDKYILVDGKCSLKNDYIQQYCYNHNNTGNIPFNSFKCNYCQNQTYPVDLINSYVCTNVQNLNEDDFIQNCNKYKLNIDNAKYECVFCKKGYYLENKICVLQCSDQNVTYIQDIVKFAAAGQDTTIQVYNKYSLVGKNYCGARKPSDSGCQKKAVNTFIQNVDYSVIDYSCVECQQNTLPVILNLSTTNLHSNNLNSKYKGNLNVTPGLSCIEFSRKTIYGTDMNPDRTIKNCEYYMNIKKDEGEGIFGCLKCKYGYTGIVKINSDGKTNGYVDACVEINDQTQKPIHGLNENCNLDYFYQGYTTFSNEIQINLIPLESFLSCFKCNQIGGVDIKPFLFLSFEDLVYYPTGSKYTPQLIPSNPLKISPHLDDYIIFFNQQYIKGEYLRCLRVQTSSLYQNSTKRMNELITTFNSALSTCALFIVNIIRYSIAQITIQDTHLHKDSVYCGACEPGYKATLYSEIFLASYSQESILQYVPYIVIECLPIASCNGGTWVNNCEKCNEGFTWKWDQNNKYILYNECIECNIPNCIACQETTINSQVIKSCQVCAKGYELFPNYSGAQNQFCEKIKIAFCLDDFNFYQSKFKAHKDRVSFGRNYLAIRDTDDGCTTCDEGYISLQKLTSNTIYQKRICSFSSVLEKKDYLGNQYLVENCFNYIIDDQNENLVKCLQCDSGYSLTEDNKCLQQTQVQNCRVVKQVGEDFVCTECDNGYIFLNSKCEIGTMAFCLEWQFTVDSKSEYCKKCNSGYVAINGQCQKGEVNDCELYNSSLVSCNTCDNSFQLFIIKDNVNLCFSIQPDLQCVKLSPEEFKDQFLNCIQCTEGYYADTSTGETNSYCFPIPEEKNCLKYDKQKSPLDSTLKCIECESQYYLNIVGSTCTQRQNIDNNCKTYNLQLDECILCNDQYYLSENKQSCIQNPTGVTGCILYIDQNTCDQCDVDLYLKDNSCLEVPTESKIQFCQYYTPNLNCNQCVSTHYFQDTCKETKAQNCKIAKNSIDCQSCNEGYGLKTSIDGSNCIKIEDPNCTLFANEYPFACIKCTIEYYPDDNGKCVLRKGSGINHCVIYETETTCLVCDVGYVLSIDKVECQKKDYQINYIDSSCSDQVVISPHFCLACNRGFYFDNDGKCIACEIQTLEKGCAFCNPQNLEECLLCNTEYYMNDQGECVKNDLIITNDDKDKNEEVETTKYEIILLISSMILLLIQF